MNLLSWDHSSLSRRSARIALIPYELVSRTERVLFAGKPTCETALANSTYRLVVSGDVRKDHAEYVPAPSTTIWYSLLADTDQSRSRAPRLRADDAPLRHCRPFSPDCPASLPLLCNCSSKTPRRRLAPSESFYVDSFTTQIRYMPEASMIKVESRHDHWGDRGQAVARAKRGG